MKKIFIDTNLRTQNNTIQISKFIADNMELQVGERVIAYQEADSWEAEIVYENGEWVFACSIGLPLEVEALFFAYVRTLRERKIYT